MFILYIILAILWLYVIWTRRNIYILSWKMPGPTVYIPIVGNILGMWNEEENSKYLDEISQKYPSPTRVWMGPNLYIFVHDAESAEQVLKGRSTLNKPKVYEAIHDALGGDGLFSSNGEVWKMHRKLMSPSLKDSTVFSHLSIFNYYIREFCNTKLDDESKNGKPFDVMLPLNVCLLSMYLDATLGIEWHQKTAYANFFSDAISAVIQRMFRPWLQVEWFRKITNYQKKLVYFQKFSDEVMDGIIKRSLENGSNGNTFLDKLITVSQQNKNFTLQDIKVEAHTLLIGASDTTGVSLSTLLLMLAMHEDVQEKVYQELLNIMPNSDVDLTPALINKMIYLDQCLRETQRLFPTVPLIGRAANETINLKGYDIPANIPIFIGIRQIHRRDNYYGPTAHLFDPDRFKPNENHPNKEQQGIYLPFSLGPRNCIGYSYAIYTMKLVAAHILRNYHLKTPLKLHDLKVKLSISFRLINKHLLSVHKRDN
ncbi:probable cytochrome P450 313a4 [Contarinia nasturtii]|uniref:probable cytochrome P450 313a4 n=1 Tax=Contarinia nasturtii TaxID=265458 RepID=UPI0012D4B78E|nr:probable cytochrome P450 313a4 [Contarinia nasturtii]